mgnify:CR=1 FL=1
MKSPTKSGRSTGSSQALPPHAAMKYRPYSTTCCVSSSTLLSGSTANKQLEIQASAKRLVHGNDSRMDTYHAETNRQVGWFDAFGELHMAYCSKPGQQANGQFFTPSHICELMVMCAAGKKEDRTEDGRPHMRQRKTPAGIPCAQSGKLSGRRRHQPDLLHDDRMQHARPRMCRGSDLS